MLDYFDGLLARSYGERFDEVCEWTQVELFGNPSKGVLELFEAEGAGNKIEIFRPLAGFKS